MKGKTYEEILKSKEKSDKLKKIRSNSQRIAHNKNPLLAKIKTKGLRRRSKEIKGKSIEGILGEERGEIFREGCRTRNLGKIQSKETREKRSLKLKGRVITKKARKKMSKTRREKFLSGELTLSSKVGAGKGGFREDLGHYVRSSYEHNFARFLKQSNIAYKYECKHFCVLVDRKITTFTPDFNIKGIWFEIKNSYNVKDKVFNKKLKSFKKLYKNEKIYIVVGNLKDVKTWSVMKQQEDLVEILVKLEPLGVIVA